MQFALIERWFKLLCKNGLGWPRCSKVTPVSSLAGVKGGRQCIQLDWWQCRWKVSGAQMRRDHGNRICRAQLLMEGSMRERRCQVSVLKFYWTTEEGVCQDLFLRRLFGRPDSKWDAAQNRRPRKAACSVRNIFVKHMGDLVWK